VLKTDVKLQLLTLISLLHLTHCFYEVVVFFTKLISFYSNFVEATAETSTYRYVDYNTFARGEVITVQLYSAYVGFSVCVEWS